MGKQQDRSSTPPADGPPPLGRHNGVEPNAPWSTQATPTTAGMPSPSRRGADPGTAAHLVGAAGYLADPRPPSGSLLNGGAGEHRPAPWQRVHDLPRDTLLGRGSASLGSAALDSSSASHHLCKASTTEALAHREAAPPLAVTGPSGHEQSRLQSQPPPPSLAPTASRGVAATSTPLPAGEARSLSQAAAEALARAIGAANGARNGVTRRM